MFKVLVVAEEWWSDHLHTNVIGRLFKQFVQQDVGDGVPCLTAVAKEIALRVHDGACFVERCCTWLLVRLLGFSVTDYTIPCFFA